MLALCRLIRTMRCECSIWVKVLVMFGQSLWVDRLGLLVSTKIGLGSVRGEADGIYVTVSEIPWLLGVSWLLGMLSAAYRVLIAFGTLGVIRA